MAISILHWCLVRSRHFAGMGRFLTCLFTFLNSWPVINRLSYKKELITNFIFFNPKFLFPWLQHYAEQQNVIVPARSIKSNFAKSSRSYDDTRSYRSSATFPKKKKKKKILCLPWYSDITILVDWVSKAKFLPTCSSESLKTESYFCPHNITKAWLAHVTLWQKLKWCG